MKKQMFILIGGIFLIVLFLFVQRSGSHSGTLFETRELELGADEFDDEFESVQIGAGEVEEDEEEEEVVLAGTIFVDVQGEVLNPGVFEVEAHVRIGYVIDLAGGLTADANVRQLNQAARVYDEMMIFVPHVDDILEYEVEMSTDSVVDGHTPDDDALISLSTASQLQLQSLPGIGPTLSENIIHHREANGAFSTVDELMNVAGIGA